MATTNKAIKRIPVTTFEMKHVIQLTLTENEARALNHALETFSAEEIVEESRESFGSAPFATKGRHAIHKNPRALDNIQGVLEKELNNGISS